MAKYLFVAYRTTQFEDVVEADTQEQAVKIYDQFIVDDMDVTNQYMYYETYGMEIKDESKLSKL